MYVPAKGRDHVGVVFGGINQSLRRRISSLLTEHDLDVCENICTCFLRGLHALGCWCIPDVVSTWKA